MNPALSMGLPQLPAIVYEVAEIAKSGSTVAKKDLEERTIEAS